MHPRLDDADAGMCPWRQPWSSTSAPRPSGPKKGGAGWQEPNCAVLDEPQGAKTAPSARKSLGKSQSAF